MPMPCTVSIEFQKRILAEEAPVVGAQDPPEMLREEVGADVRGLVAVAPSVGVAFVHG